MTFQSETVNVLESFLSCSSGCSQASAPLTALPTSAPSLGKEPLTCSSWLSCFTEPRVSFFPVLPLSHSVFLTVLAQGTSHTLNNRGGNGGGPGGVSAALQTQIGCRPGIQLYVPLGGEKCVRTKGRFGICSQARVEENNFQWKKTFSALS